MVSEIAVILFFISMILETAYVFSQITNEEPVWKWAEDVAVLFLMILLVSGFLIQENKKEWLIIGVYLLGLLAMMVCGRQDFGYDLCNLGTLQAKKET